ncbi:MAG: elongation factor G [Planctomycetes bacterium]|nr:elongation factor G [Planctomycetota bacterium]
MSSVGDLRNFTLLGHGGSGKTSIVDAIAFHTKVTSRHGSVTDGSSISDTEPEEREKKQTLTSHLFHFPVDGKSLRFLDNPGHPDFIADAISSLRAVETAVFTVDAASGVTFNTRRLWGEAEKAGVGRVVLLTKPDAENISGDEVLQGIVESFGDKVVPITVPDGTGKDFTKVLKSLAGEGDNADTYRSTLHERVAEADDELMERYFEAGELSDEELHQSLPLAIAKGTVVPLLTVAAPTMVGVSEAVDFLAGYCPSPAQVEPQNAAAAANGEAAIRIEPDPSAAFCGFVFKIESDPFVGKMSFIRVLRGTLTADDGLTIARTGDHEKVGGLLIAQGKETENVESAGPGDLVAVAKVETLELSDTVTKDGQIVFLPPTVFPSPMVAVAVEPKSRGDEQKIGPSLEKLAAEDPTLSIHRQAEVSELVVEGLSSLHLDLVFSRLKRRYKVEVEQHVPRIPYRETCMAAAEGHHRHKKQSGGRGQFGEVYLRLKALDRGEGFNFVDKIAGGRIPRAFIPEVQKGIVNMMKEGPIAGCPMVDCEVELYDGKFHDVDSDQLSFQLAGGRAFLDAFEKAKPILLEPVMKLAIRVPSRFTGDITSNLANQRGRMTGMDADGDDQIINCVMPLKESRAYQTQLRSITAGEGSFTMEFSHYDPVPPNLQQEIRAAAKKAKE